MSEEAPTTNAIDLAARAAYDQALRNVGVDPIAANAWEKQSEKRRQHFRTVAHACVNAFLDSPQVRGLVVGSKT